MVHPTLQQISDKQSSVQQWRDARIKEISDEANIDIIKLAELAVWLGANIAKLPADTNIQLRTNPRICLEMFSPSLKSDKYDLLTRALIIDDSFWSFGLLGLPAGLEELYIVPYQLIGKKRVYGDLILIADESYDHDNDWCDYSLRLRPEWKDAVKVLDPETMKYLDTVIASYHILEYGCNMNDSRPDV